MALKKIVTYPHPVLRQKTQAVTAFDEQLQELIADLAETMYAAPGAGLAANQIGISLRVAIIEISALAPPSAADEPREKKHLALINPEILSGEGSQLDEEGCLSVADFSANVKRFQRIRVRAQDPTGQTTEFEAKDHFARVIQHEVDHLDGILFIDHVSSLKRSLYKKRLKKQLKEEKN